MKYIIVGISLLTASFFFSEIRGCSTIYVSATIEGKQYEPSRTWVSYGTDGKGRPTSQTNYDSEKWIVIVLMRGRAESIHSDSATWACVENGQSVKVAVEKGGLTGIEWGKSIVLPTKVER